MALVYPFKGILYNREVVSGSIMAPPYDVIDEHYKEKLKKSSPYNVVRITLPSSYEGAKKLLDSWLSKGVLEFDRSCSFYIYTCKYRIDSEELFLKGIIGAMKVEEFGNTIKPHEKTLKGPKIDRFNLITKTHTMFCPIMGLYAESRIVSSVIDENIKEGKPIFDEFFEDSEHKLFRVNSLDYVEKLHKSFKNETIIIADGHHRYETALMMKKFYNEQGINRGGFDYIMILLIDSVSGGLSLFPIHRLIKRLDSFYDFEKKLRNYFIVEDKLTDDAEFVMYYSKKFFSLKFKLPKKRDILKSLSVTIFEDYIYKKILKLTDDDIKSQRIAGYAHSEKELIELVDSGKAEVGFLLKPMSFRELVKITDEGLTVPQKSTFFYPKIPSGIVGYHFESIEGCVDV